MLMFVLLLSTAAFQTVSSQYAFVLVKTPMNWASADNYCKSNHRGLADILSIEDLAAMALTASETAWIGLHYNATIKGLSWSNGLPYIGASWMPDLNPFMFLSGTCGTMFTLALLPSSCNLPLPFICSYYITASVTTAGTGSLASTQLLPSTVTGSAPTETPQRAATTDADTDDSTEAPASTQRPPATVTGSNPTGPSQGAATTDADTDDSTEAPASTQRPPATVTSSNPTGLSQGADTGYLILKVDFLTPVLSDLEAIKEQLLNEVEEILTGSFPKGSFQLKWVSYEQ